MKFICNPDSDSPLAFDHFGLLPEVLFFFPAQPEIIAFMSPRNHQHVVPANRVFVIEGIAQRTLRDDLRFRMAENAAFIHVSCFDGSTPSISTPLVP